MNSNAGFPDGLPPGRVAGLPVAGGAGAVAPAAEPPERDPAAWAQPAHPHLHHYAGMRHAPVARAKKKRHIGPVSVPAGMFLVMFVMCFMHMGRMVELFYPAAAVLIALWLYRVHPAHYLGFTCWVFFLSAELRRIGDFFAGGFNPVSTIMVAPLACAAISGLALITDMKILGQRRAMPLALVLSALLYTWLIGVTRAGFSAATFALATAIFPALVGFRMVATWREYPDYQRVLLNTFIFGAILMGVYGIYQFISPPPWDVFWHVASGMTSEGEPVPFGLRISSTMNSSGPFANTALVCILMALAGKGKLRVAASIALPALMFTSVRSAWGGLLLGLIYPVMMLDGRSRMRLIAGIVACVVICLPVTMIDEVSKNFGSRLGTVQNLGEDNSYQVRAAMYSSFMTRALTDISGQGFGTTGTASKLADNGSEVIAVLDSGLMEVPYTMGWPGTLLYVAGIATLITRAFAASRARPHDRFAVSGVGIAVAIVAMMIFSNTLAGMTGMFFFIGVLMPVNGLRYAREAEAAARRAAAKRRADAPAPPPVVVPQYGPRTVPAVSTRDGVTS
ncbi:hypothetical protein [Paraburkholderia sp. GAS42]|uniref:hypothetical protein n=1 Tax=Paraburkholderia sp. GAS42 TaxID=3035135 RepID=UPI003D24FE5A